MPIIVFDIDDTICTRPLLSMKEEEVAILNPECIMIDYVSQEGEKYPHIFAPHIGYLIKYLLSKEAQIVFFSSAIAHRNEFLVPALLQNILGLEEYEAQKSNGQFKIFSNDDMRKGRHDLGEGNYVKDLSAINPDDTSDIILIEDDPSYVAHDQRPCIEALDCMHWHPITTEQDSRYVFSKNTIYHLLGLFEQYFNNYDEMPIREAFKKILPEEKDDYTQRFVKKIFTLKMIDIGYDIIKSQNPDVKLYGMEKYSYYAEEEDTIPSILDCIKGLNNDIEKFEPDSDSEGVNLTGVLLMTE